METSKPSVGAFLRVSGRAEPVRCFQLQRACLGTLQGFRPADPQHGVCWHAGRVAGTPERPGRTLSSVITMETNRIEALRTALQQELAPVSLEIIDDSAKHAGHAGARE